MRVGRTDVFLCAWCEKPLPEEHTVLRPNCNGVVRLCPGMECVENWALTGPMSDKVELSVRREINAIWKLVDPASRKRLRKRL